MNNRYWIDKFYNLRKYITYNFAVEVNLFDEIPKDLYADDDIDLPYNGTAFLDDEIGHMIDVYGNVEKYPTQMICVLIHEFGHILAFIAFGKDHSEEDAWFMGRNYFKEEWIPPNFNSIMLECLDTYQ